MERIDPKKTIHVTVGKGLLDEALNSLRNDPDVYPLISEELKLSQREVKENLPTLLDYQDDVHYCQSCPGLEKCAKATPCFCLRLSKVNGMIYRHLDPCHLKTKQEDYVARFLIRDFPLSYMDAHLKNVEKSASSRQDVIRKMSKNVLGKADSWLYLIGNRGAGKSYLLAAYANAFSEKKAPVAFCDASKLIEQLKTKSIEDKEGFEELFHQLVTCPLLILDDFGNEFKSEYTFSMILFPLLNERAKEKRITAFGSDFSIKDIGLMYKEKIGGPRANQLYRLLKDLSGSESDISGVAFH